MNILPTAIVPNLNNYEKRDYFAALAMQALLSYKGGFVKDKETILIAKDAYTMANAMMEERENGTA